MRILVCLMVLVNVAIASESEVIACRDAVVLGYAALERTIERESFSTGSFDQFGITPEQFNALSADDQIEIYQKIKPLPVMVEETIAEINSNISQVAGSFYEFFMADELQRWRAARDVLRSCDLNE